MPAVADLPTAFRGYSRLAVEERLAELQAALAAAQTAYEHASLDAAALREQLAEARAERDAAAQPHAVVSAVQTATGSIRVFDEPTVEAPTPTASPEPAPVGAPLPRPAPAPGRRGRHLILPTLALLVAIVATVLVLTKDDGPVRTPGQAAGASAAPSTAASTAPSAAATAAAPRRPAPLQAYRPLPSGWESYRDPQGRYAVGLPLSWRAAGPGRFVSASGKSELRISSAASSDLPTRAELGTREKAVAAGHRNYRRIGLDIVPFHELPAGVWSFTYGAGADAQRVSELVVLVDARRYSVRMQSRAANWSVVQPLLATIRATFHPAGLA
jgi:hypothetical protein